jgi:hypothetical protein
MSLQSYLSKHRQPCVIAKSSEPHEIEKTEIWLETSVEILVWYVFYRHHIRKEL